MNTTVGVNVIDAVDAVLVEETLWRDLDTIQRLRPEKRLEMAAAIITAHLGRKYHHHERSVRNIMLMTDEQQYLSYRMLELGWIDVPLANYWSGIPGKVGYFIDSTPTVGGVLHALTTLAK